MKQTDILETTLRDGSYAINFSFTAQDTFVLCRELESVGFEYIEVGHGAGLNARNSGLGVTAANDEEYMKAARRALKRARYGMFCIPGIAKLSDLNLAKKHRMGFIRIGTNVNKVEASEAFIKKAKRIGMYVAANYMKSYALSPKEFAKKVILSEKYGADVVYIVDSAGGMMPGAIKDYVTEIRKVSDMPLGFHGHNNLGFALANSLDAVKMGFRLVDASLQGIGRSSGNACTETLVAVLKKAGYETGIDFLKLLKLGQKYIYPILPKQGQQPLDIVSGYAEFHSSYMPHILKYAAKYRVEAESLIIEMCKINKVDVEDKTLEKIAEKLRKSRDVYIGRGGINQYVGGEQEIYDHSR